MKILNFGSLNIDMVYQLPHIVRPGETLSSHSRSVHAGGKGANQSVALARAGADVFHAGKIGDDGQWLKDKLSDFGVNVSHIAVGEEPTGHAIIQLSDEGENSIVLLGGANKAITRAEIDQVFEEFASDDLLLIQNEINEIPYIIECAHAKGMKVYFNPAPFGKEIFDYPLDKISTFIVNETEGMALAGFDDAKDFDAANIIKLLVDKYPGAEFLLTMGGDGVAYACGDEVISVDAQKVDVVDTTAAGDTFIGFYMSSRMKGQGVRESLELACRAAAITVTRLGAADSIPALSELCAI